MDLRKNGRQFGQASTPSLFTSLVNEHKNYYLYGIKDYLSTDFTIIERVLI